jgi:hypothetical protein
MELPHGQIEETRRERQSATCGCSVHRRSLGNAGGGPREIAAKWHAIPFEPWPSGNEYMHEPLHFSFCRNCSRLFDTAFDDCPHCSPQRSWLGGGLIGWIGITIIAVAGVTAAYLH